MRIVFPILLLLHGFAHVAGFSAAWKLSPSVSYKTTVLAGRVDLGDLGIRLTGMIWLALAGAFAAVAIGAIVRESWWMPAAIAAASASLLMSLLEWPAAKVGVVVNGGIILVVLVAMRVASAP